MHRHWKCKTPFTNLDRTYLYLLKKSWLPQAPLHFFSNRIIFFSYLCVIYTSLWLHRGRKEGSYNSTNFIISFQFWLCQIVFYCLDFLICFCFSLFIIYKCMCISVRQHWSICTTWMQEPEERRRGCGIPGTWLTCSCESSICCEWPQSSLRVESAPNH